MSIVEIEGMLIRAENRITRIKRERKNGNAGDGVMAELEELKAFATGLRVQLKEMRPTP